MPLHPQSQKFLAAAAARNARGWNQMPLADARLIFDNLEAFGEGPQLQSVADFTTDTGLPIRVYQPSDPESSTATVVYFHGGGWVLGNIQSHDSVCRTLAAESQCSVVSVEYRCAPEHRYPTALHDCLDATKFVAERPTDIGLTDRPIVIAGDSAGGNLACGVSMMARTTTLSLAGQVLIYPVVATDFNTGSYRQYGEDHGLTREVMQWFWSQYLGEQSPDGLADLLKADSFANLPATHIITAECDVLRSEGEQLVQRLRDDGVVVSFKQYDGMLHGFVHFLKVFDAGREAIADIGAVVRSF